MIVFRVIRVVFCGACHSSIWLTLNGRIYHMSRCLGEDIALAIIVITVHRVACRRLDLISSSNIFWLGSRLLLDPNLFLFPGHTSLLWLWDFGSTVLENGGVHLKVKIEIKKKKKKKSTIYGKINIYIWHFSRSSESLNSESWSTAESAPAAFLYI
jgi:hypothetical protein